MGEAKIVEQKIDSSISSNPVFYVLDTNVLVHDPTSILNFDEHHVVIPIIVLEELDSLKSGRHSIAADCRQAIRELDNQLGQASPAEVSAGVAIQRCDAASRGGTLSVLMTEIPDNVVKLPTHINDNKILNDVGFLKQRHPDRKVVLVTKDINVRLKARGLGIESQDYHSDQLLSDIEHLNKGYIEFEGDFWSQVDAVETIHREGSTQHVLPRACSRGRSARISLFMMRWGLSLGCWSQITSRSRFCISADPD